MYQDTTRILSAQTGYEDNKNDRSIKYLGEMVETDAKLIRTGNRGKGMKGATYRPNRAGITKEQYMTDLGELYNICLSKDLMNSRDFGWFDCRLLGVPPDEDLTSYEREVVRAVREKLADAWQLTYFLRYVIADRVLANHERRDVKTLRVLYEHKFSQGLQNIFFSKEPDLQQWKLLLDSLVDQIVLLCRESGLAQDVGSYFTSFRRVAKVFPPAEDLFEKTDLARLILDEDGPLPRRFSERLALVVRQSFTQSEEFRGRLENYIYGAVGSLTHQRYTKFEELKALILATLSSLMAMGSHRLVREERERLRNWNLLLGRYGRGSVDLFLQIVDELNAEELRRRRLPGGSNDKWVQRAVGSRLRQSLRDRSLLERYMTMKFDNFQEAPG